MLRQAAVMRQVHSAGLCDERSVGTSAAASSSDPPASTRSCHRISAHPCTRPLAEASPASIADPMPPLRAAIGYLALSGPATRRRHPVSAMLVAGAMVGVLGASGCSIIHAVRKVTHAIEGNKQTV